MTDRLAATALRLLAPRATAGSDPVDGDDLANLNTTNLPNHSMCWVNEGAGSLYQLDRDAVGDTFNYADGLAFQVDPNEGPGLWLPMQGEVLDRLSFYVDLVPTALGVVVTGADIWSLFNVGTTSAILGSPNIAPLFTVTGNFLVTYNGPAQRFLVDLYVSVLNQTGANTTDAKLAIQDSDTIIFNTNTTPPGEAVASMTAGATVELHTRRLITLADNTLGTAPFSLLPLMRTLNGDDLTIVSGRMVVTPQ